jgi:nucleoside-diphosphate-sugar epimerase
MYCQHLAKSTDNHLVTLRLYSVYGPWEEPNRLIPTLVEHAQRGAFPPLAHPDTVRDFVYVDDVVEAFLRAEECLRCPRGAVYNIGTGRQTTLRELVATARSVFSIDVPAHWASYPRRSWDTDVWVADVQRAGEELGWTATCELSSGLQRTGEWLERAPDAASRYRAAVSAS